ncbi:MAG: hypothetical protein WAM11_12930 [Cyanobium sp.]
MTVGRVIFRAKPAKGHPLREEWETADIVVLVRADDEDEAIWRAIRKLAEEHWEPIGEHRCDRLIANRVRSVGADFLAAYEEAERSGASIRVFSRQWARREDQHDLLLPLRISEAFMDDVVKSVGGSRLPADGYGKTADYRIGNWIFELKDLQEEGLIQKSRQQKIYKLFYPYLGDARANAMDPNVLNEAERRELEELLGSPIQKQVKSASKQIRATKEKLGERGLRGGLIYLNTGYSSLQLESLGPMVERYVQKDTTQIDAVLCVSFWVATNGLDTYVIYRPHPVRSENLVIEALRKSFETRFEEMMTSVLRGEIPADAERATPLAPITFAAEDETFCWDPGDVEPSWK